MPLRAAGEQPGVALEVAGRGSRSGPCLGFAAAAGPLGVSSIVMRPRRTLARMDFLLDLLQGARASPRRSGSGPSCPRSSSARSPPATSGSTSTAPTSPSSSSPAFLLAVRGRWSPCSRSSIAAGARAATRPSGRPLRACCSALAARARRAARRRARSPTTARDWWPGVLVGVAVRRRSASWPRARCSAASAPRLDAEAAERAPVYAEGAALLAAGLSVLFPPLAVLVIGGARLAARRRPPPRGREVRRPAHPAMTAWRAEEARPRRHRRDEARDARAGGRDRAARRRCKLLIERGHYVDDCVAAFPSVTPVCAASIATGTGPGPSTRSRR